VTKSHLAAKVPEPDKFPLFWKLIWKENIKHIILLDNCFEDDQVIVHTAKLNSSRLTFIGNS
jgi:protein tyrosine phosphatase